MPRPKRLNPANTTIKELLIRFDIEPLAELFQQYKEEIRIPHDLDPKVRMGVLADMIATGWGPVRFEDGNVVYGLAKKLKVQVMGEAANYIHPKLRASENHSTTDHSITVTINKIADGNDEKRISGAITIPIKAVLEPKMIE